MRRMEFFTPFLFLSLAEPGKRVVLPRSPPFLVYSFFLQGTVGSFFLAGGVATYFPCPFLRKEINLSPVECAQDFE